MWLCEGGDVCRLFVLAHRGKVDAQMWRFAWRFAWGCVCSFDLACYTLRGLPVVFCVLQICDASDEVGEEAT